MTQLSLFSPSDSPSPVRAAEPSSDVRRLSKGLAALSDGFYLGTSSWSFPGWQDIVYDRKTSKNILARHGLAAYARHPLFRSVGIDRTYYGPITAEDFSRYADVVPEDFRFLVKAHEIVTRTRLPGTGERNDAFLDPSYATEEVIGPMLEGLGNNAGVLLFQFPPQSVSSLGGAPAFAERLHHFLRDLPEGPAGFIYAMELRNAELLTTDYQEVLNDTRACHCLNVHPTMPPISEQARQVRTASGPALVVRWMLGRDKTYEGALETYAPFDRIAAEDSASRREIASACRAASVSSRRAFVIVNNKAEGSAPLSLIRLAEEIMSGED